MSFETEYVVGMGQSKLKRSAVMKDAPATPKGEVSVKGTAQSPLSKHAATKDVPTNPKMGEPV